MGCLSSNPSSGDEAQDIAPELEPPKRPEDLYHEIEDIEAHFAYEFHIGKGASATVWAGKRKKDGAMFAIKSMSSKFKHMFTKELKVLRRLDCPQIVRMENAYMTDDTLYIALEYCSGDQMLQRVASKRKYTEGMASKTFKDMLLATKFLHDRDLIHRDIKPENFVYLSKESDAGIKLLDFGIAMDALPTEEYRYRAGTPYYMPPEVIRNAAPRDGMVCRKGDMWSLGVCLFIMLNGQAPFKGSDKKALFDNILFQSKIKFQSRGISKEAKKLVFALLQRDPAQRISVEQALAHDWIVKGGEKENEILKSTVEALKLFSATASVHRALQLVAKNTMQDPDHKLIEKKFTHFDKNNDKLISRKECYRTLVEDMGYAPSVAKTQTDAIFAAADHNKDNEISLDEFKDAMAQHQLHQDEYRMHAVFSALDLNRDGRISLHEIRHVLKGHSDEQKDDHLEPLLKAFEECDADNDGKLSFEEFKNVVSKTPERKGALKAFVNHPSKSVDYVLDDDDKYDDMPEAQMRSNAGLQLFDANSQAINANI